MEEITSPPGVSTAYSDVTVGDGSVSTASTRTMGSRSTIPPTSSPSSPQSPASFSRRRRRQAQRQELRLSSSRPKTLFGRNERKPPSFTTVNALSESVSYSSSEGEDEHESHGPQHEQEHDSIAHSHGLEWMHEEDPRSSVMDLEMGVLRRPFDSSRSGLATRPSSHRRHGYSPTAPSATPSPPSVSSSISSSSFRSRRNQNSSFEPLPLRLSASPASNNNDSGSSRSSSNATPSLRASLDAGMAAVRSWIRSRGTAASSSSSRNSSDSIELRPRSRSVTWQPAPYASSTAASVGTAASVASTTQNMEELDDLLQQDDLSVNSTRTDDSHRSSCSTNTRYRPASAPTIPLPYRHRPSHQPRTWSIQPDTILEESGGFDDGEGGLDSLQRIFSRKRSQSEPDGRRIPDFFLGPAPSTRYNTGLSNTRQRRRYTDERRRPVPRSNNPAPPHSQQYGGQQNTSSAFTRRPPRRPGGESDLISSQQLSSSAAAALYDNPNHNTSVSSFLLTEFSDAGASVGTAATAATAAPESAFELAGTHIHESRIIGPSPVSPSSGTNVDSLAGNNTSLEEADARSRRPSSTMGANDAAAANPTTVAGSSGSQGGGQGPDGTNTQVDDAERQARIRWIRINRRFQFVITVVALMFSLLLFAILICWVVLTCTFVLAFDKSCDAPLKPYFWLVTLQLVMDVFRSDIMRLVFQWDANSNQRIPVRVIAYNITYLIYALLVLRLGIRSVFIESNTCRKTAPELYNTSIAFVSLSISAWATIVCGYLIPFCVVAALLTCNGYNPTSQTRAENVTLADGTTQPVFPAAYATTGAPPGTVDRLAVVQLENLRDCPSHECCICMEDFKSQDVLVETSCKHVFHKHCCREWLRQARTCPVCRTDIPGALQVAAQEEPDPSSRIPIGPTGRPVVGLFRILRRTTGALSGSTPSNRNTASNASETPGSS
eukprot:CAMPEP_0172450520 /NCGR_PEP_ID=MMETSP1065-20121228/8822_1 /TAXON_ID=265537 /ORGANISM="Amphiprora paludosa, Strain CCMP125" /LENGTH=946 /DNA_ID=CAMNT_0013202309 /DNA_START=140 /DNA_END=2980 /DNA_ORIENTATION=+